MTPDQEQSACAAWMKENDFVWFEAEKTWVLGEDGPDKPIKMMVQPAQALFFYGICQKAEQTAYTRGYNSGWRKRDRINNRSKGIVGQLRNIVAVYDADTGVFSKVRRLLKYG